MNAGFNAWCKNKLKVSLKCLSSTLRENQHNGDSVSLFLREGHVVLTDGYNELESRGFYADGNDHMVRFKTQQNGTMLLEIDNGDRQTGPARSSRRRRQDIEPEIMNAPVFVYIGGAENSAMFHGCIKRPFITRGGQPHHLLMYDIRCGSGGTVCGGRPLFNACSDQVQPPIKSIQADGTFAAHATRSNGRRRNKKRRRKNREDSGNRPSPLVVSIQTAEELHEGYDASCALPYQPATSGFRYTGDGYSKYYVKRFNPHNWRYSLFMRTTEKGGLIFFMSDTRCNEHIAVYLVKGRITFSVMFGVERSRLKSLNRYNDGDWHHVTFERKGNSTQLMLDGSIEGQGEMFSESMTFPSNMPFYVGGLHAVPKKFAANQINRKNLPDFRGCIKDIMVNNMPIDTLGTGSGLRINVSPCFEGGTEPGMYFPHREDGGSSAYMVAMNTYNVGNNMEVTLEIKPRSQNGILFAVGGTTGNFFNLALVEGRVAARLRQGGETLFSRYNPTTVGGNLCDGAWHTIRVIKARNIIALTVDDNLVTPVEEGTLENRQCRTNGALFIGGLPDGAYVDGLLTNSQYTGCIRKMRVDFFPVNPNTSISVHGDITTNACPVY